MKNPRKLTQEFKILGRITHCKISCKCGNMLEEKIVGVGKESPKLTMARLRRQLQEHTCGRKAIGQQPAC